MKEIESWCEAVRNSKISSASRDLKTDLIVGCEYPYIIIDTKAHIWGASIERPMDAYYESPYVVLSGDQCVVVPEPVYKSYYVLLRTALLGAVAKVECTGRDLVDSVLPRYCNELGVKQFTIFENIHSAPNF